MRGGIIVFGGVKILLEFNEWLFSALERIEILVGLRKRTNFFLEAMFRVGHQLNSSYYSSETYMLHPNRGMARLLCFAKLIVFFPIPRPSWAVFIRAAL